MMLKSPELLQKRLYAKGKESDQKRVIALSGGMFLAAFMPCLHNKRCLLTDAG